MVAADRYGVPLGHPLLAELHGIGDKAQARLGRINIGSARDVFLQNVVLDGSAKRFGGNTVLLRHRDVQGQQNGGGGVDGHRSGNLIQRNVLQQNFHVLDRSDGHSHAAHFTVHQGMIRVVANLGGQIERHGNSHLPRDREGSGSGGCSLSRCRNRRIGASSRACPGTCSRRCRACRDARPAFHRDFPNPPLLNRKTPAKRCPRGWFCPLPPQACSRPFGPWRCSARSSWETLKKRKSE